MDKLKIGDKVEWTSGAGGRSKKKEGQVVGVVSPGETYSRALRRVKDLSFKEAWGGGLSRGHESYLILVPHHGEGKPTLYWPRVCLLKPINELSRGDK